MNFSLSSVKHEQEKKIDLYQDEVSVMGRFHYFFELHLIALLLSLSWTLS